MDRLVDLYAAWEKPEEAAKWRAELGNYPQKPGLATVGGAGSLTSEALGSSIVKFGVSGLANSARGHRMVAFACECRHHVELG